MGVSQGSEPVAKEPVLHYQYLVAGPQEASQGSIERRSSRSSHQEQIVLGAKHLFEELDGLVVDRQPRVPVVRVNRFGHCGQDVTVHVHRPGNHQPRAPTCHNQPPCCGPSAIRRETQAPELYEPARLLRRRGDGLLSPRAHVAYPLRGSLFPAARLSRRIEPS